MKYRAKKNKIKQEHGMIKGLQDFLSSICATDIIHSIIPGRINPAKKATAKLVINRLTKTDSGWKAVIQSGASIQEVFFVSNQVEELAKLLEPYYRKK